MTDKIKRAGRLLKERCLAVSPKRATLITASVMLLAAVAAVPFFLQWRHNDRLKYSGAEVNDGVKLLYDAETLGNFRVTESFLAEDGTYRERISGMYRSEIRLWRDFERPKLPCREAAEEKYPELTAYSGERAHKTRRFTLFRRSSPFFAAERPAPFRFSRSRSSTQGSRTAHVRTACMKWSITPSTTSSKSCRSMRIPLKTEGCS